MTLLLPRALVKLKILPNLYGWKSSISVFKMWQMIYHVLHLVFSRFLHQMAIKKPIAVNQPEAGKLIRELRVLTLIDLRKVCDC